MQRNQEWKGLQSNASPFGLPPGVTQQQVNVHCRHQGSLSSRGGMRSVSPEPGLEILDAYSCLATQTTTLVLLTSSGELATIASPSVSEQTQKGFEPRLSSLPGQTITNYLWQYATDGSNITNDLVYIYYGGSADQESWTYELDAENNPCDSPVKNYDLGDSKLTEVIGIDPDNLCDYGHQ